MRAPLAAGSALRSLSTIRGESWGRAVAPGSEFTYDPQNDEPTKVLYPRSGNRETEVLGEKQTTEWNLGLLACRLDSRDGNTLRWIFPGRQPAGSRVYSVGGGGGGEDLAGHDGDCREGAGGEMQNSRPRQEVEAVGLKRFN